MDVSLGRFLLRRVSISVVVLVGVSMLSFALLELAPGDPARSVLEARSGGRIPSAAAVAEQRQVMGLDDPLPLRYLRWAGDALSGDLGSSYITGRSVVGELAETVPWTLLLTLTATVFSVVGGLSVGLLAGLTRRHWLRRSIETAIFVLGGMPGFVTGLLLLYFFAAVWHVLPSGGVGRPGTPMTVGSVAAHLVLPAAALAFGHHFGAYVRLVQTGVARTRDTAHVENAQARGLSRSTIALRHVLRPGLVPFAARLGVGTGALLAGGYAIEIIFSWPGLGRMAIEAAREEDYPILTAAVLVTAIFVLLANLLGELVVAELDPRVRLSTAPRVVAHEH